MNSNLAEEEIQDRYGHGLSEDQIKSLFPYDDGESYYVSGKVINGEPYLSKRTIVEFEVGHGEDREGNPTSYALNLLVAEVPEERQGKYGK